MINQVSLSGARIVEVVNCRICQPRTEQNPSDKKKSSAIHNMAELIDVA